MVLEIILAVLLAASVAGNVFQAFFGLRIEQNQDQRMESYTISENGNVNINGYGMNVTGDKITWELVTIQDVEYLTNFLKTLNTFQALNADIIHLASKTGPAYIVFYPRLFDRVTTNKMSMTNWQSNSISIGFQ
jgi:hypothetical protein